MFKNENGFTLIEMLVVILIISLLMLLIIPNLGSKSEQVNKGGCEALKAVVQNQVDMYYLDEKKFPENLEVLKEGYLRDDQLECGNQSLVLNNKGKVVYEDETNDESN